MFSKIKILQTTEGMGLPLPAYTSKYHAAINLYAAIAGSYHLRPYEAIRVPLGFSLAIPNGLCAQILSTQSLEEQKIVVLNAPVLISPADREPLSVLLFNGQSHPFILKRGMKIAQLLFMPYVQVTWDIAGGILSKKVSSLQEIEYQIPIEEKKLNLSTKSSIRYRYKPKE